MTPLSKKVFHASHNRVREGTTMAVGLELILCLIKELSTTNKSGMCIISQDNNPRLLPKVDVSKHRSIFL